MLLLYNPVMSKEQLLLARLIGIAIAVVLVGLAIIGVAVSTSGILQPTVRTGRASVAGSPGPSSSTAYRVESGSMEPTLPIGTRVIVRRDARLMVGLIVVYHPPQDFAAAECGPSPHVVTSGGAACDAPVPGAAKVDAIKRIVAGPGDEMYVREGHVYRRTKGAGGFMEESDGDSRVCGSRPECNFPFPIRVPAGHWFLMGDNRGESNDSRFWGPVPTASIVGVARGEARRRPHAAEESRIKTR
jgi:signal peptidase I